jgi:hypothetical protein
MTLPCEFPCITQVMLPFPRILTILTLIKWWEAIWKFLQSHTSRVSFTNRNFSVTNTQKWVPKSGKIEIIWLKPELYHTRNAKETRHEYTYLKYFFPFYLNVVCLSHKKIKYCFYSGASTFFFWTDIFKT